MWSFVIRSAFLLLALPVIGQVIATRDSRTGASVTSSYTSVDVGDIDPIRNPDWRDYNERFPLRSVKVPALIDLDVAVGVAITGTVAQAEIDLSRAISNQFPAIVRERKNPTSKEERNNRAANVRSANGWNDGREQVARMAEEIQLLWEELERLKSYDR